MSTGDYKDEAEKFLSKQENLEVALDVAELMEGVKDKLVLEFWHALKNRVSENQRTLSNWSIKMDSDDDILKGHYPGLDCVSSTAPNAQHSLRFRIERGSGDRIYEGVCWNKEMKTPFDQLSKKVPHVGEVRDHLQSLSTGYSKPSTWWIGWQWLNAARGLREKTSLLRVQDGRLPNEVAEEFLELLEKMGKLVQEANSKLLMVA